MRRLLVGLMGLCIPGSFGPPALASEWGCEVLLCAASSDPSWRSIATCHPPMEKLMSAMKKPGFSWPTCPEGGAGKPGFERYADCPVGWTPAAGSGRSNQGSGEQPRCSRIVNNCRAGRDFSRNPGRGRSAIVNEDITRVYSQGSSCRYTEYAPRPLRAEPYYFDIRDEATGKAGRYWFDLDR